VRFADHGSGHLVLKIGRYLVNSVGAELLGGRGEPLYMSPKKLDMPMVLDQLPVRFMTGSKSLGAHYTTIWISSAYSKQYIVR
jgi:hypothetical protein